MKWWEYTLSLISVGLIFFFVGRFTKPPEPPDTHKIDSLQNRARQGMLLVEQFKQSAQKAFQKGVESQKGKVVIKKVYVLDTAKNHALSPAKKDSIISGMSENFILDQGSENTMLKSNAKADSVTIESLTESNLDMEKALTECEDVVEAKDGLLAEKDKEVKSERRKTKVQKALKWLAVGGMAVVTYLGLKD